MLTQEETIKILKKTNSLLEGHFILSSGLRSEKYLQCAQLMMYPDSAEKVCKSLAEKIDNEKLDNYKLSNIINVEQFNRQNLRVLFKNACTIKHNIKKYGNLDILKGKTIGLYFDGAFNKLAITALS